MAATATINQKGTLCCGTPAQHSQIHLGLSIQRFRFQSETDKSLQHSLTVHWPSQRHSVRILDPSEDPLRETGHLPIMSFLQASIVLCCKSRVSKRCQTPSPSKLKQPYSSFCAAGDPGSSPSKTQTSENQKKDAKKTRGSTTPTGPTAKLQTLQLTRREKGRASQHCIFQPSVDCWYFPAMRTCRISPRKSMVHTHTHNTHTEETPVVSTALSLRLRRCLANRGLDIFLSNILFSPSLGTFGHSCRTNLPVVPNNTPHVAFSWLGVLKWRLCRFMHHCNNTFLHKFCLFPIWAIKPPLAHIFTGTMTCTPFRVDITER